MPLIAQSRVALALEQGSTDEAAVLISYFTCFESMNQVVNNRFKAASGGLGHRLRMAFELLDHRRHLLVALQGLPHG